MVVYRVRARIQRDGERITSEKYWLKRRTAQQYADETNKNFPGANARVVKGKAR